VSGNDTLATAAQLDLLHNADSTGSLAADADVSTLQDKDVYRFNTLLTTGSVVVRVRTVGVSLLAPRVTLLDASGRVVGSAVTTDPLEGGVTLRVDGVRPLSTYYVQVDSGRQDVFGIGGYHVQISTLPPGGNDIAGGVTSLTGQVVDTATNVLLANDLHTDDT